MSKRSEQLAAMRHVADTAKLLLGGSVDIEALRQAVALWDTFKPNGFHRRKSRISAGGEGGGTSLIVSRNLPLTESPSKGEILESQKPSVSANSVSANSRQTWLSPFASAWVKRFGSGSQPPWGMMARSLKPLVTEHGADEVARRWSHYLTSAEARYVSVPRFAETFGAWTTPDPDAWKHDKTAPRPGESVDAYIMRLANAGY